MRKGKQIEVKFSRKQVLKYAQEGWSRVMSILLGRPHLELFINNSDIITAKFRTAEFGVIFSYGRIFLFDL